MLRFARDESSQDDVREHLEGCDDRFRPPLSTRVNITAYAEKIRARARTFEAWEKQRLVALVAVYTDVPGATAYITSVSVLPGFERRGIATKLLNSVIESLEREGIRSVMLEVSAVERGARRLVREVRVCGRRGTRRILLDEGGVARQNGAPGGGTCQMRNHNVEFQDSDARKYAYDFDGVIRRYLLRSLQPYLRRGGTALELGCFKGDMTEQILESSMR